MENKNVKFITIDGSTKKTGIAYFCNGKYQKHYLLDYEKEKDVEIRFDSMAKDVWKILETIKPNIVYMETTYMGKNAQVMKILTRLQGVIYAWCMHNDCEFSTITPAGWRKQLGFKQKGGKDGTKRKELKAQSIQYVLEQYKLEVGDDEADAICIADAVLKMFEERGKKV